MQVDLTSVAPEVTHDLWKPIEGGQVGIRDFWYLGDNLTGTFWHIFWQIKGYDSSAHSGLSAPLPYRHSHQECEQCRNKRGDCLEICNNEVKWDTHKSNLWPTGCWPGQRRGLARGEMILLKVNSWNNSGASPQGRRSPICRLLRWKKEKGFQEVVKRINVSHNFQWIKLPGKSDPFTVVELGNQWLRFWIFFLLFS